MMEESNVLYCEMTCKKVRNIIINIRIMCYGNMMDYQLNTRLRFRIVTVIMAAKDSDSCPEKPGALSMNMIIKRYNCNINHHQDILYIIIYIHI